MASAAEPFYITQFQTEISGILPNSSDITLVYMNFRINKPPADPSYEIPNIADLESVRPVRRSIKLINKNSYNGVELAKQELDDLERGHFTIDGLGTRKGDKYESFGTGFVNHMSISIDDDLQGMKLSTALLQGMLTGIAMEGIRRIDDQKLFIDTDGSAGFWDKLGMKENPRAFNFNGPRVEGNGYEKMITIGDIREYLRSKRSNSPRRRTRSNSSRRRGGKRNLKNKSRPTKKRSNKKRT
jgi:hypothetical protein